MSAARPAARRRPAAGPPAPTTVLLVDDQAVIRKGIRVLLDQSPGILVVGEARDGVEGVAMTRRLDPDVVLMDIGMPNMNGFEATRQIRAVAPRCRVLILSAHADDDYIERVTAMGAAGYVLKHSSLADLTRAILATGDGGTVTSPAIEKRRLTPGPPDSAGLQSRRVPRLSSREAEVLQLIAEGKANKETAAALGISIKTVEKHRQRLMAKLDIHDVAGLTRYATTSGMVECRTRDANA